MSSEIVGCSHLMRKIESPSAPDSPAAPHPLTPRRVHRLATRNGHIIPVDAPYRVAKTTPIISHTQRLGLLRHIIEGTELDQAARATATLFLLLAQTITRIATMTVDQLDIDADHVPVRITDNSLTIPAPFDEIVHRTPPLDHTHPRGNHWLFPGAQPGLQVNQVNGGAPGRHGRHASAAGRAHA